MAHVVGESAAAMGATPSEILTQCVGLCTVASDAIPVEGLDLGCINGAAHTWVLRSEHIEQASQYCQFASIDESVRDGCFHGLGHGLSERYQGNLTLEIEECAKLPTDRGRFQCAHAVFMESQVLPLSRSIPMLPTEYCHTLVPEIAKSCYEFAGFMEHGQRQDVSRALHTCNQVPQDQMDSCSTRVGESIYLLRRNVSDIASCLVASESQSKACLTGFISRTIDTIDDRYGDQAFLACQSFAAEQKTQCFAMAGNILQERYGLKIKERSCLSISGQEERFACQGGLP
jgi:hypothetical protein